MTMAGFTAEISLFRTPTDYRTNGVHGSLPGVRAVVPQLPRSGCGDCAPLRWPDGRPTGACARACCDVLGRCWTETCACGGGAVAWGGGGIFARER
jgi:hypothetical protein